MADIDPSEYTIGELRDELGDIEDPETLRDIREAESDGEDRSGAKEAIDERLDDVSDDQEGEEGESQRGGETNPDGTSAGIVEVRNRVRDTAGQLIGRPLDGIVEIERTDDGCRAVVEIIERSSVPDTQDIIGRYALELDSDSEITGYRRLDRYRRGNTRREELPGAEPPR